MLCWLGAEKTDETKRSESGHEDNSLPSNNKAILDFIINDLKSTEKLETLGNVTVKLSVHGCRFSSKTLKKFVKIVSGLKAKFR